MDVASEGDLLNMFQKEFRKMHCELVDKEVGLFHHMFHHLFSSRLAKLEQFLQQHYDEFESFEPEYAPLNSTPSPTKSAPRKSSRSTRSTPTATTTTPTGIKIELQDFDMDGGEEESCFSTVYEGNVQINPVETDDFVPSEEDNSSDGSFTTKKKRKRVRPTNTTRIVNKRGDDGDGDESDGEKDDGGDVAKTGRKRLPIWECFNSTFSPKGKVLRNRCKGCQKSVSPKPWRMQMHVIKCLEIQNPNVFTMSTEVRFDLKRCKAKLAKDNETAELHMRHSKGIVRSGSGTSSFTSARKASTSPLASSSCNKSQNHGSSINCSPASSTLYPPESPDPLL